MSSFICSVENMVQSSHYLRHYWFAPICLPGNRCENVTWLVFVRVIVDTCAIGVIDSDQFYCYVDVKLFQLGNITHRGSNSEVHLQTPQQKVPFSLIRCSSSNAKGAYCSCVAWGLRIYNIVESESDPLTRRPVDLFEKEPLKGNSKVHLHTPTKFGEDPSKDLGGDREHTHKRCSNYSMMYRH